MNINQRVEFLISKTVSSKSAFSKATGISTVILSHISSGRNKVSLAAVEQILSAYPNVSADWLVLGKGKMLKDDTESTFIQEMRLLLEEIRTEQAKQQSSMVRKMSKIDDLLNQVSQ